MLACVFCFFVVPSSSSSSSWVYTLFIPDLGTACFGKGWGVARRRSTPCHPSTHSLLAAMANPNSDWKLLLLGSAVECALRNSWRKIDSPVPCKSFLSMHSAQHTPSPHTSSCVVARFRLFAQTFCEALFVPGSCYLSILTHRVHGGAWAGAGAWVRCCSKCGAHLKSACKYRHRRHSSSSLSSPSSLFCLYWLHEVTDWANMGCSLAVRAKAVGDQQSK